MGSSDAADEPASRPTQTAPPSTSTSTTLRTGALRRVLFVGDSLMFQAADELGARFGAAGVETRFIGYPGTGLLSGQGWWNREITAQVDSWRPDAVVIEACCNYSHDEPRYEMPDGSTIAPDSPAMYAQWARLAEDAVRRAGARGADVYWVTTPAASPDEEPEILTRIDRFNTISAGLDVPQIDWRSVLTPGGVYSQTQVVGGKLTEIRSADGLHISDAGNVLVAEATFAALRAA